MALKKSGGREPGLAEHGSALEEVTGNLPNLVMIYGQSDFFRFESLKRTEAAWLQNHPAGEIMTLRATGEAKPLTFSDIVSELSGSSLFAKEKMLVVRQAERLLFPTGGRSAENDESDTQDSGGKGKDKSFLDYLENPSAGMWLVLESTQLLKNRILGKKIAASCVVVPCPQPTAREIPGWLRRRAEEAGKHLDNDAAEMLLTAYGADAGVLASEIDKLALYVPDSDRITAATAREFMTGTVEFDIFGFTNALQERNPADALYYARKIAVQGSRDQKGKKDDGERSAHRTLAMAASTVQNLLRAGVAKAERKNAASFAAEAKIGPWQAERLLAAAGKYSLPELRKMAAETADSVKRSHDTGGDARLALELLAVKLTR